MFLTVDYSEGDKRGLVCKPHSELRRGFGAAELSDRSMGWSMSVSSALDQRVPL